MNQTPAVVPANSDLAPVNSARPFPLFMPNGLQIPWIDPKLHEFAKEDVLGVEVALVWVVDGGEAVERYDRAPLPDEQVFASVYLRMRRGDEIQPFNPLECIADLPEAAARAFAEAVAQWYGVELMDMIARTSAEEVEA